MRKRTLAIRLANNQNKINPITRTRPRRSRILLHLLVSKLALVVHDCTVSHDIPRARRQRTRRRCRREINVLVAQNMIVTRSLSTQRPKDRAVRTIVIKNLSNRGSLLGELPDTKNNATSSLRSARGSNKSHINRLIKLNNVRTISLMIIATLGNAAIDVKDSICRNGNVAGGAIIVLNLSLIGSTRRITFRLKGNAFRSLKSITRGDERLRTR